MLFFIYIIFFIPENWTYMCLLCEDVGLVQPAEYERNMRCPWPGATSTVTGGSIGVGELPASETERVLRQVERNFTSLTRTIPMVEIKDLTPYMHPHIVGAPQTWVHPFHHLENIVDYYNKAHRPHP
jgi:hypothetical protein